MHQGKVLKGCEAGGGEGALVIGGEGCRQDGGHATAPEESQQVQDHCLVWDRAADSYHLGGGCIPTPGADADGCTATDAPELHPGDPGPGNRCAPERQWPSTG